MNLHIKILQADLATPETSRHETLHTVMQPRPVNESTRLHAADPGQFYSTAKSGGRLPHILWNRSIRIHPLFSTVSPDRPIRPHTCQGFWIRFEKVDPSG